MGNNLGNNGQAGTVAVIDDDFSVRRALSRLLRAAGVSVETYTSAEEFFAQRNGNVYSLLLVDVAMGQMSGIDLLEQLAARGGAAPPAIVITAVDTEAIRKRARRCGAPVLRKPIETEDLLKSVGRALGRDLDLHIN
jgi:FixJ family two-component response regulator